VKTPSASQRRFFRFSYLRPYSAGLPHLHELRDGDAFAELAVKLVANGYQYGGLLLNYQGVDLSLETTGVRASDVIVLTTRPPLDDDPETHRLFIEKTGTDLERVILATISRYFEKCSRARIVLKEELSSQLKQANRGDIIFTQYGPACYSELRSRSLKGKRHPNPAYKGPNKTAAFFVRTRIGERGPGLIAAFSIDGPQTLVWCHLLRTRFSHLLTSDRFVMAEMSASDFPAKPIDLSFARNLEVELLLNLRPD
jgi:hypothetical protein